MSLAMAPGKKNILFSSLRTVIGEINTYSTYVYGAQGHVIAPAAHLLHGRRTLRRIGSRKNVQTTEHVIFKERARVASQIYRVSK